MLLLDVIFEPFLRFGEFLYGLLIESTDETIILQIEGVLHEVLPQCSKAINDDTTDDVDHDDHQQDVVDVIEEEPNHEVVEVMFMARHLLRGNHEPSKSTIILE